MEGTFFWVLAVLAAATVGAGKGGLPIVGMLAVPILSLAISPVVAAGMLLPVYVISDVFGLYAYRREFDRRVLVIACIGMTVGVGVGWATASLVSEAAVTLLVGVVGLSFALNLLARRRVVVDPQQPAWGKGLFWTTVAGFTSFVSHAGAPPYQVFTLPLGMRKAVFAGTSTIAFAYVNALKLIPYYFLGQLSPENLWHAAMLMPVAAISVFAGVWIVRRLPETLFFQLVTWALLLISARLIWDGAAHLMAG
ncbi:sulfite exporter TauE/SafE family protein [Neotabrizicola shimadae]|uniref:Probable membrane transporter protein n=1 Tax=Neotabrizicola shimadae TaxID=2807096 RepID=A0A8G1ED94_9RHOB|nr:sulfite exporter TauE/SafE family protein [Neotabrizicola shimadae]QYZ69928.1 sulfite exporter TauE/SafE family protein [Neotabrizicola shimadae]